MIMILFDCDLFLLNGDNVMSKDNLPSSFKEAIKVASKFYFTNKPCIKGHLSKRFTVNGNCYECLIEYQNKKRELVKEIFKHPKKDSTDKY